MTLAALARKARDRLWQAALVVVAVLAFNFTLINMAPGDPVDFLSGEAGAASESEIRMLRERFGLDRPLLDRFLAYAWNVLTLDLGYSYRDGVPVLELILVRLPPTLLLMGTALGIAFLGGIVLGLLSARRVNGPLDTCIAIGALLAYATPMFWSGLMLIVLFGVKLQWLPLTGMTTPAAELGGFALALDIARHLAMPAFALSLFYLALYTRLMRASVLEVRSLDYVRTARSKGLSERRIELRHVLRNALLPMVTMIGVQVGAILGGSVVIESTFGWPGLGRLAFEAVGRRDYNLLLAILLFSSVLVVLVNFAVDVVYALIDPRIEDAA